MRRGEVVAPRHEQTAPNVSHHRGPGDPCPPTAAWALAAISLPMSDGLRRRSRSRPARRPGPHHTKPTSRSVPATRVGL